MMRRELSPSREGESQQSDKASSSKKPKINFATRQYQLHGQQQSTGKETDAIETHNKAGPHDEVKEQNKEIEQLKGRQKEVEKQIKKKREEIEEIEKNYPNIKPLISKYEKSIGIAEEVKDIIKVQKEFNRECTSKEITIKSIKKIIQLVEDIEKKQKYLATTQKLMSYYENRRLDIDDFELCSLEFREPYDQTQVTSSQSFPEIRQHSPAMAFDVEQPSDAEISGVISLRLDGESPYKEIEQRHEAHGQADTSSHSTLFDVDGESSTKGIAKGSQETGDTTQEDVAMTNFLDKRKLRSKIDNYKVTVLYNIINRTKKETSDGYKHLHKQAMILKDYAMYHNYTKEEAFKAYTQIKKAFEEGTYNETVKNRCKELGFPFAQDKGDQRGPLDHNP